MMKKILSILLILVSLVSVLPNIALANDTNTISCYFAADNPSMDGNTYSTYSFNAIMPIRAVKVSWFSLFDLAESAGKTPTFTETQNQITAAHVAIQAVRDQAKNPNINPFDSQYAEYISMNESGKIVSLLGTQLVIDETLAASCLSPVVFLSMNTQSLGAAGEYNPTSVNAVEGELILLTRRFVNSKANGLIKYVHHYDSYYKAVDSNNEATVTLTYWNSSKQLTFTKDTNGFKHKVFFLGTNGVYQDVTENPEYCVLPTNGAGSPAPETIDFKFKFKVDGIYAIHTIDDRGTTYNGVGAWCIVNCNVAEEAVDETKLQELQTLVTNLGNGYYQTDDRWNGGDTYCASGFWATYMKTAYDAACEILQNPLTNQSIVDAINALNAVDKSKLIPVSQVNATALYEALQETANYSWDESSNWYLGNYTYGTAMAFSDAREAVQTYLNSLFKNGAATDMNIADNQGEANRLASVLLKARASLLPADMLTEAQRYRDTIVKLDTVFKNVDPEAYSNGSDFAAARAAAAALIEEHPANENLTRSQYDLYISTARDYWLAAYGLRSKTAPKEVTVYFSDDFGMRYPEYALGSVYAETLTMDNGTYTLKELLTQTGLATLDHLGYSRSYDSNGLLWDDWLVYINGILVRDPRWVSGNVDQTILLRDKTSMMQGYVDWNDIYVRDGDVVILARVEAALMSATAGEGAEGAYFSRKSAYFGQLMLTLGVDSAAEGEGISADVRRYDSYLLSHDGRTKESSTAWLAAYGPRNEDGSWPTEPIIIESSTELTLYQAGVYLVTAFEPREQSIENMTYPNLTVSSLPQLITITPLSTDELAQAREDYEAQLDAALADCDADMLGQDAYAAAASAVETAKDGLKTAESLAEMQELLETALSTIETLTAEAESANTAAADMMRGYLRLLPDPQQIADGKFTQNDVARMGWASELYDSMTDYQRSLLNAEETQQWQALTEAFGTDGTGLPVASPYTLSVSILNGNDVMQLLLKGWSFVEENAWGSINWSKTYTGEGSASVSYGELRDDLINIALVLPVDSEDDDPLQSVSYEGAELYNSSRGYQKRSGQLYVTYTFNLYNPRQDLSVVFTLPANDDLSLARSAAVKELNAAYASYSKSDYTAENWATLTAAYSTGVAAINKATSKGEIDTAKQTALDAMHEVDPKAAGDLGSVRVIVENTTNKDEKLDAALKDTITDTTVALTEQSTMMKCVLAALAKAGYSWTGTGGSGYEISYLASINITVDGVKQSLAEFDAGNQSGWMGTLNDWFVNEGFNMFTVANGKLKDGDVICVQYTVEGYGTDLGATWANNDTSLKKLTANGGSFGPEFDGSVLEYVLTPEGGSVSLLPTAANKNFQVRIFLNQQNKSADAEYYRRGESIPVKSGDVIWIGVGEKAWASMNDGSITGTWYKLHVVGKDDANAVVKLINAIGSITYSNYETKQNAVDLARAAYDALNSAAQGNVTNYTTLTKAEAAIAGYQKVGKLKDAIAALPKNITEANREAVEEAEDLYNELAQDAPDLLNLLKGTETNKLQKAINTLKLIDALEKVSEIDFVSTKANTVAAVIGALEDELGGMKIDGKAVTVVVTLEEKDFTAADETGDGNYTASVSFTLGSGSQAATQKKTVSGTIKRSDDNSVQSIKVNGKTAEPVAGKDGEYEATLSYGSDPAKASFVIVPAAKATVSVQPALTGSDGHTWTWKFTVKAENGDTKQYAVTLSVSDVMVTVLDSWVYSVSDDVEPVKLAPSAVTNLLEAVNPDKLGLAVGTEEAFLWLEVREKTGDNVYTVTPVFAAAGGESTPVPAAALSGKIGLTLPVPGTEYARVVFGGEYLDATGSASGITFEVAEAGDYTLIPDAHVAAVAFHLCGGNSDDVTDGEKVVFYREDLNKDLPRAVKSGSSFVGWNSKEDGSGKTYAKVSADLPADLYAVWWTEPQEIEVNKIVDESKVTVDAVVNDEGEAVVTVYSEEPCVAIVKIGDEYKRLSAVRNEDGSYSFTQEDYDESMEFFVLLKGDTNGDGEIDISDFSKAKAASLRKKTLEELGVTELGILATDLDGEDGVDAGDIAKLKAAYLHKTTLNWDEDE